MNEANDSSTYIQHVKIKCGDTIKEYRYKRNYNISNKTKMFKELLNEDETKKILSSNSSNYDKITNLWTYISNNEKYKNVFNYKQIQNLVYRHTKLEQNEKDKI